LALDHRRLSGQRSGERNVQLQVATAKVEAVGVGAAPPAIASYAEEGRETRVGRVGGVLGGERQMRGPTFWGGILRRSAK